MLFIIFIFVCVKKGLRLKFRLGRKFNILCTDFRRVFLFFFWKKEGIEIEFGRRFNMICSLFLSLVVGGLEIEFGRKFKISFVDADSNSSLDKLHIGILH